MARTLSAEEYEELGKRFYKLKQYDKAIEAFTNGIEASIIPAVTLCDYRAASYMKLGDFNAAVKDGREAIRLHKQDVRGYLRTASALERMHKLDTALNIYKYGMKNVPVDDKNFKLLPQLHDKLTRKLSPDKAIDPLAILPVELVEMVLGYLPFRTIVNCLRVSKGWKRYLTKRPKLWTDLDLSGAKRPVSRAFIRDAVKYAESRTTRLVVHRFQHTDVLRNIATVCKDLTYVEIISLPSMLSETLVDFAQCAMNLKKLIVRYDISLDTVTQVLRWRPNLEHAEFTAIASGHVLPQWKGPFPHLHTLHLRCVSNNVIASAALPLLMAQCPTLQSLELSSWSVAIDPFLLMHGDTFYKSALTSLVLTKSNIPVFPRLPPSLKRLVVQPFSALDPSHGNGAFLANPVNSYLPELTHLTLSNIHGITPTFLEELLDLYLDEAGEIKRIDESKRTPLQHLCLRSVLPKENVLSVFGPGGLIASPRLLSRALTSLDIPALRCTDDDVEALVGHTTSLQSIDLSSTQITGAGVKMLADGLPELRYLKVDNCNRISSRDAIIYAENKGVTVSCKIDDTLIGGRKVRYR